jgi:hypothetical protein
LIAGASPAQTLALATTPSINVTATSRSQYLTIDSARSEHEGRECEPTALAAGFIALSSVDIGGPSFPAQYA